LHLVCQVLAAQSLGQLHHSHVLLMQTHPHEPLAMLLVQSLVYKQLPMLLLFSIVFLFQLLAEVLFPSFGGRDTCRRRLEEVCCGCMLAILRLRDCICLRMVIGLTVASLVVEGAEVLELL
jgi:hypothetical protein